jgi:PPM family protein phosphatase
MQGKMDCFGLTDAGKVRAGNEDQFLLADLNKSMFIHQTSLHLDDHTRLFGASQGRLMVVADGMGGQSAGERASSLAVDTLARYVLNTMPWLMRLQGSEEDDLKDELVAVLQRCQERIEAEASAQPSRRNMGTTLTMAYLVWPRLYVVHAGDSRCYLLRAGRLEQITRDQTVAQQLVDKGALPPEKAEGSRWSHVLWNCLGGGSHELNPEVYKATLQLGDAILLCTDGLTKSVADKEIAEILGTAPSAEEACRLLVHKANGAGGPDNITVVVARFHEAKAAQAHAHKQATAEVAEHKDAEAVAVAG